MEELSLPDCQVIPNTDLLTPASEFSDDCPAIAQLDIYPSSTGNIIEIRIPFLPSRYRKVLIQCFDIVLGGLATKPDLTIKELKTQCTEQIKIWSELASK